MMRSQWCRIDDEKSRELGRTQTENMMTVHDGTHKAKEMEGDLKYKCHDRVMRSVPQQGRLPGLPGRSTQTIMGSMKNILGK